MTDRTEALDIEATKRKVQEIENRLRNASEGRWEIVLQGEERRTLYGVRSIEPGEEPYEIVDCWQGEEDAVLIACAPDDLRTLIQALRASNEERERVRALVTTAREELARWGWGDFHYGSHGQEQSVVDALAVIDAALSHPISPERSDEGTEK